MTTPQKPLYIVCTSCGHREFLSFGGRFGLTECEARIADMVMSGMRNQEIADANGTLIQTVKNQMRTIQLKVGVRNRVELAIAGLVGGKLRANQ
jgi:DNA-binding CsgD family transcriptional regulator